MLRGRRGWNAHCSTLERRRGRRRLREGGTQAAHTGPCKSDYDGGRVVIEDCIGVLVDNDRHRPEVALAEDDRVNHADSPAVLRVLAADVDQLVHLERVHPLRVVSRK